MNNYKNNIRTMCQFSMNTCKYNRKKNKQCLRSDYNCQKNIKSNTCKYEQQTLYQSLCKSMVHIVINMFNRYIEGKLMVYKLIHYINVINSKLELVQVVVCKHKIYCTQKTNNKRNHECRQYVNYIKFKILYFVVNVIVCIQGHTYVANASNGKYSSKCIHC